MGKSGSGKSTFLQIIGGLDKPDNGEVIFKNDSIYSKNKNFISNYRNKEIGFIFQSYHLLPDLNVYEKHNFTIINFIKWSYQKDDSVN